MKRSSENISEALEVPRRRRPMVGGIYVYGKVQGIDVTFTLDTGLSRTVMSMETYLTIPEDQRPVLRQCNPGSTLYTIDGREVARYGEAVFQLTLGPLILDRVIEVASIDDQILLGADLLLNDDYGPADLLLSQNVLRFGGVNVPLEHDQRIRQVREVSRSRTDVVKSLEPGPYSKSRTWTEETNGSPKDQPISRVVPKCLGGNIFRHFCFWGLQIVTLLCLLVTQSFCIHAEAADVSSGVTDADVPSTHDVMDRKNNQGETSGSDVLPRFEDDGRLKPKAKSHL